MRWRVEDTPERAAFRAEFRGWLRGVLPAGWVEALERRDVDVRRRQGALDWKATALAELAPLLGMFADGADGHPRHGSRSGGCARALPALTRSG